MRYFLIIALLLTGALYAEGWIYDGDFNFSLNQGYYSENWHGEESSSVVWTAIANATAEKQCSELIHNRNTLKLAFGQTHRQVSRTEWEKPEKTTDEIKFETLFKFTFNKYVDPFVSGRLESQFLDHSDMGNIRVFNKVRLIESAGVSKDFITQENQFLTSRLGVAFRETFDRDRTDAVSGKKESDMVYDGGIEFITEYKRQFLNPNTRYKSRLLLYQALINSEEDNLNDDWKALDVNWEHQLSTKIWSVVDAIFFLEFVYEKEQSKNIQFRETVGLAISYKLF